MRPCVHLEISCHTHRSTGRLRAAEKRESPLPLRTKALCVAAAAAAAVAVGLWGVGAWNMLDDRIAGSMHTACHTIERPTHNGRPAGRSSRPSTKTCHSTSRVVDRSVDRLVCWLAAQYTHHARAADGNLRRGRCCSASSSSVLVELVTRMPSTTWYHGITTRLRPGPFDFDCGARSIEIRTHARKPPKEPGDAKKELRNSTQLVLLLFNGCMHAIFRFLSRTGRIARLLAGCFRVDLHKSCTHNLHPGILGSFVSPRSTLYPFEHP